MNNNSLILQKKVQQLCSLYYAYFKSCSDYIRIHIHFVQWFQTSELTIRWRIFSHSTVPLLILYDPLYFPYPKAWNCQKTCFVILLKQTLELYMSLLSIFPFIFIDFVQYYVTNVKFRFMVNFVLLKNNRHCQMKTVISWKSKNEFWFQLIKVIYESKYHSEKFHIDFISSYFVPGFSCHWCPKIKSWIIWDPTNGCKCNKSEVEYPITKFL